MLNNYERHLIVSYLSNAASHFRHYHTEAKELAQWVAENRDVLAINDVTEELGERRLYHEKGLPEQDWRLFTKAIEETRSASRHVRGDRTALRLWRLGKEMHLTRTDVAVLESLLRYRTQPIIESLVDNVFGHGGSRWNSKFFNVKSSALSCLLGVSAGTVLARFAPDALLVKSGLVAIEDDGDVRLIDRLRRLDSVPGDVDVQRLLLDVASPSELDWSDFDHVAAARDHVESILKGALQTGALGVNVLVYGPPGTGKNRVLQDVVRPVGSKALQRRRIRRARRRTLSQRETSGTPAHPAPVGSRPRVNHSLRRNGRPACGSGCRPNAQDVRPPRTPGPRLESVHAPAA